MAKPFDATLKQIIDDYSPDWAVWLEPVLGLPAGPVEVIDPDLSTVQPTADKVFRLPGDAGLLHLEVQTSHDAALADRMLVYNVLLHDRHCGPVRSVALLLRRHANAPAVDGTLIRRRADGSEDLRFGYDVVRVWDLPANALLSGGLGIAPLGLLTDDAEGRLSEVLRTVAARVTAEVPDVGRRDRFLAACYLLMGMRYDKGVLDPLFVGVQQMRESSTYQAILQEGRSEGLSAGRSEGLAEGQLKTLRQTLVMLLEQKFGSLFPGLEDNINASTDAAKLQAAVLQVATIQSLTELVL